MDIKECAIKANRKLQLSITKYSPNISDEIGVLKISPVNSQAVCLASIPLVPSKTLKTKKGTGTPP